MDSRQRWGSSSSRTPTESGTYNPGYQRAFDSYLYQHLLRRNLQTTAQIFKQESQVADVRTIPVSDTHGDLLYDWWTIFYDAYTARQNGEEGNGTPLYPQGAPAGQTPSIYDLPPLPPELLQEPRLMPLVSHADFITQSWLPILESSSLVAGTSFVPIAQAVPNGAPLVTAADAFPPVQSAPNDPVQVNGASAAPPGWWAYDGAVTPANGQTPVPSNAYHNIQSPGSSGAVVLTPWNVNSVRPAQIPQSSPPRRGIRVGGFVNDPIDVEVPVASPAPRKKRPRRQAQSVSRGSSSRGPNVRPRAVSLPPPGFVGMSPGQTLGQRARLSRTRPYPALQKKSTLVLGPRVNSNASSGSLVPSSSHGVVGQVKSYGPLLNTYQGMLSSTSIRGLDAQNSANRMTMLSTGSSFVIQFSQGPAVMTSLQNSIPMAFGTSDVINSLPQGISSEKNTDGMNSEGHGQPSTAPAIVSHATHEPQNGETDSGAENNEEVSSAIQDPNMEKADQKDGVDYREDSNTVLGEYLSVNYGPETKSDPVAPLPQQPHPQQQSSQLTKVWFEVYNCCAKAGCQFKREACLESNLSELWCCHFSSDGKYLACAGVDRKVKVWSMSTLKCNESEEHHGEAVTDIRFKPNSPIFASASFDKTIRLWDATKPEKALACLIGHATKVTSLDFHPTQFDILCSCDAGMEIRYWNLSNQTCIHATKGASQVVRFQPQKGKYLAAVAGNTINILDTETCNMVHCLKSHIRPLECVSWDASGRYLVSACQESIRIWSVATWCTVTHKLAAENGVNFKSCIFHPRISHVVIIGNDKNIEIWNPMQSARTLVVSAHESHVAGLTTSICGDIIASASHDGRVMLWKCG